MFGKWLERVVNRLTMIYGAISPVITPRTLYAFLGILIIALFIGGLVAGCVAQEIRDRAIEDHSELLIRELLCADERWSFLCGTGP
jgi:hypothetical protein